MGEREEAVRTRETAWVSSSGEADRIHEMVREYYGEILGGSDDLRTDACCCISSAPPKYVLDAMALIDDEVIARFYGCGSPIPPALEGATVLDLGCGTGRDVFICSKLVGPTGRVIGIDMTPAQLKFARSHETAQMERFGFPSNVEFVDGYIEDLAAAGIPDVSIDVVVSNCVVNLSPFKELVFSEIFRVLKAGGELYFSDIFSDRRVPEHLHEDPILRGECLSGAMYVEDFRRMLARNGIAAFYDVETAPVHVGDLQIDAKLDCIGFASHTIRAIKCDTLEDREEDYGQTATYLGTMPENPRYFDLAEQVRLIKNRPVAVSGNMAEMLLSSRYARHFEVTPRGHHRGGYDFESAQKGLALARGKARIDLAELERACERLDIKPFDERVHDPELLRSAPMLETMQLNVTHRCNLACSHCYLESGPAVKGTEMSRETMEAALRAFEVGGFKTLDITGGAPELNPELEWLVRRGGEAAEDVIVRSNLAVLDDPAYAHLPEVYADAGVHLVASLPYFDETGVDAQRGAGSFERIIGQIRRLNELGYGSDPRLVLDIAYNVIGPFLPPDQGELQEFYAYELGRSQRIRFNGLFAFNNWCLGRFAAKLMREHKFDYYLDLLSENYNSAVVARMMCRSQVNVDFDGRLYDCEVNHVLGLPITRDGRELTVHDISERPLGRREIIVSPACYTCSAGAGSSCGGSLMDKHGR